MNGINLSDRRLQALMNVLVFTPNAVYLAQGKRPPGWLIAASLAWLGISFLDDLQYLVRGNNADDALQAFPPPMVTDPYRYRVNRP